MGSGHVEVVDLDRNRREHVLDECLPSLTALALRELDADKQPAAVIAAIATSSSSSMTPSSGIAERSAVTRTVVSSISRSRVGPRWRAHRVALSAQLPTVGRLPYAAEPQCGGARGRAHDRAWSAAPPLRIGSVLSSLFCRTKQTAQLAFGRFRISRALLNTIDAEHDARWRRQIRGARRLLGTKPAPGRLTVLVTHGSVVGDTTGQTLAEGETLVFRPRGSSRFRLLGRILPREWRTLSP
jgi:hypothetical protein